MVQMVGVRDQLLAPPVPLNIWVFGKIFAKKSGRVWAKGKGKGIGAQKERSEEKS